jgi:hypothetical protein
MNKNNNFNSVQKLEHLLETLAPHATENLPLSSNSFKKINRKTINYMHEKLKNDLEKTTNEVNRPVCPAKSFQFSNKARAPYKNEMNKYINQWGLHFDSYASMPFNVFEALANYLENKS